jgi:hypothetical protein
MKKNSERDLSYEEFKEKCEYEKNLIRQEGKPYLTGIFDTSHDMVTVLDNLNRISSVALVCATSLTGDRDPANREVANVLLEVVVAGITKIQRELEML